MLFSHIYKCRSLLSNGVADGVLFVMLNKNDLNISHEANLRVPCVLYILFEVFQQLQKVQKVEKAHHLVEVCGNAH